MGHLSFSHQNPQTPSPCRAFFHPRGAGLFPPQVYSPWDGDELSLSLSLSLTLLKMLPAFPFCVCVWLDCTFFLVVNAPGVGAFAFRAFGTLTNTTARTSIPVLQTATVGMHSRGRFRHFSGMLSHRTQRCGTVRLKVDRGKTGRTSFLVYCRSERESFELSQPTHTHTHSHRQMAECSSQ